LRTVGKMTWAAQSVESGTLTYDVDGVTVSKTLYRLTLRYDDLAGTFYGVAAMTHCAAKAPSASGPGPADLTPIGPPTTILYQLFQATFKITGTASQLGAAAKLPITAAYIDCTFTGDYAQFGHFGRSQGTFSCADGTHGAHTFDLITVQKIGVFEVGSARLTGSDSSGCAFSGTITGLR